MTYDEALERIDDYLAGNLPLEAVQAIEAQLLSEPLLAMAVGLRRLEPLAGDQLAASLSPLENQADSGHPRFPRLWLLSLLAGSVVIGQNSPPKKKAGTPPTLKSNHGRSGGGPPRHDRPPPGPAETI